MSIRLVQLLRAGERRVGVVDGNQLNLLASEKCKDLYSLALRISSSGGSLEHAVDEAVGTERLDYDAIYDGRSDWRLLPCFDHPGEIARCMISGTGLTHKASAENRAAMHKKPDAEITDSIRMYRLGLEGGSPPPGQIGVQPEWFYKGNGSILKAYGEELTVPAYAWDGGEEPEIAGVYVISESGEPCRVGFAIANEFSDHRMEKKNYLYLAPSKLRNCSLGPEVTIGDTKFEDVPGTVSILRAKEIIWTKNIWTGQQHMSHTVANLEHHHFKYAAHRRPGDVHIHFFGADAFSFGGGVELHEQDVMEVSFPQFGRALRNKLTIERRPETMVRARPL